MTYLIYPERIDGIEYLEYFYVARSDGRLDEHVGLYPSIALAQIHLMTYELPYEVVLFQVGEVS